MRRLPIAIFADLHAHDHAPFAHDAAGFNSRLRDTCDTLSDIDAAARKRGCGSIICAGDLFHSRKRISVDVHALVCEALTSMLPVHAIAGNHDLSMDERTCWLTGLPLSAYLRPALVEIDGWSVKMIPWCDTDEAVTDALKAKADFYVGHFGVAGSKVGPNGFEIPGHVSREALRRPKNTWLFLGHYHRPQNLDDRTMYVGSALHIDRSDAGDEKRFVVLHPDNTVESVPLKRAPRFITLSASDVEKKQYRGARPQDFVDVVAANADESKRARKIAEAAGFETVKTSVDHVDTYVPRINMRNVAQADVVRVYVETAGVPEGYTLDEVVKVGNDLLRGSQ